MTFGFGVGDFVAVGDLAFRLYNDVFLVARHAPEEIKAMYRELALLQTSQQILINQAKDPSSALCKAGQDRVDMVNNLIAVEFKSTLTQ
jgi:hypothetical protein